MKGTWIGAALIMIVAGAFLGGCCGGGTSTKAETTINSTTTGQQLMDLKKAYDSGAITEKEYSRQKELILDK